MRIIALSAMLGLAIVGSAGADGVKVGVGVNIGVPAPPPVIVTPPVVVAPPVIVTPPVVATPPVVVTPFPPVVTTLPPLVVVPGSPVFYAPGVSMTRSTRRATSQVIEKTKNQSRRRRLGDGYHARTRQNACRRAAV